MKLVLVLVDAVTCTISLENFIEAKCLYVCAISNNCLCLRKLISFYCFEGTVGLELHDHSLTRACVEYIYDARLHEFVKGEGIMAAIVKDLKDRGIDQHVSQQLLREFYGLIVFVYIHEKDVEQEGVSLVVDLDQLYKSSLPQASFKIDCDDLAFHQNRAILQQSVLVIDIDRFSFLKHWSLCGCEQLHLMLAVGLCKLAVTEVEALGLEGIIEGLTVDQLMVGEEEQFVSLQCEHWLDLIQYIPIVYLQLLRQLDVQFIPAHQSTRPFLLQIVYCDFQDFLRLGPQFYLIELILQRAAVQHYQKISEVQSLFLKNS